MAKPRDLWAEHFRLALIKKSNEPQGAGWLTAAQFQAKAKLKKGAASRYLTDQFRAGKLLRYRGSKVTPAGRSVPEVWYRPKG